MRSSRRLYGTRPEHAGGDILTSSAQHVHKEGRDRGDSHVGRRAAPLCDRDDVFPLRHNGHTFVLRTRDRAFDCLDGRLSYRRLRVPRALDLHGFRRQPVASDAVSVVPDLVGSDGRRAPYMSDRVFQDGKEENRKAQTEDVNVFGSAI